ncbi:peptidoglycan recognition family protein [Nostoc sp. TCL26-01]|uniref:peptidoglycan recognition protein family protein n=1 Tax=Nostoc sp. TCL26-01 TaxID=2576904 RepID=UPI0015C1721C|nr:peptidoglycan recognition family protein [Nostoc sp. TCL26-01]QLE54243.1 N-acetylmuramoyl-L-alanine amidase [Nostoc sp. TCL26-01]
MGLRDWATRVTLIFLMLAALILALLAGKATQLQKNTASSNPEIAAWSQQYPQIQQVQSVKREVKEAPSVPKSSVTKNQVTSRYTTTQAFAQYKPRYGVAAVDPSNYGDRYTTDANGIALKNQPIIVIHETSDSASSAVNFFQTPHTDENVQASYHAIVTLDGTVIYLVPPEKRAFGAANSIFAGTDGTETVQTNPNLPPSVNNFAYHVSLETPPDGRGNNFLKSHSGYTQTQYNSLAWLIAQSQVPDDRITTHKNVDRSGQRVDPLSFDFEKFFNLLNNYRQLSPVYRASHP